MFRDELRINNKILYIDDNLDNSNLIKRVLEADGYCVSLAADGFEGLHRANYEQPDLILLDIHMPNLNGYEVARRLRKMEDTKNIPIVAISASGTSEDIKLSLTVGCDGYILKPIDVDLISQQIAAYL